MAPHPDKPWQVGMYADPRVLEVSIAISKAVIATFQPLPGEIQLHAMPLMCAAVLASLLAADQDDNAQPAERPPQATYRGATYRDVSNQVMAIVHRYRPIPGFVPPTTNP